MAGRQAGMKKRYEKRRRGESKKGSETEKQTEKQTDQKTGNQPFTGSRTTRPLNPNSNTTEDDEEWSGAPFTFPLLQ